MAVLGPSAALAALQRLGVTQQPYGAFQFHLEIEGLLLGSFSEVTGLSATTQVEPLREGGVNGFEYHFPGQTTWGDITLRHGVVDLDMVWSWYSNLVAGKVARRNGTIYLVDPAVPRLIWWNFYQAWPVAWNGPDLNAGSSQVAAESLTLTHHGLDKRT